jgi:hypothetical protein
MELNNKYRIVYDSENTILQFFEQRESFKKNDNLKIKGTGEIKEFIENSYYPNLKTALIGFLNKCTWNIETVEEILKELNKLEILINNLK